MRPAFGPTYVHGMANHLQSVVDDLAYSLRVKVRDTGVFWLPGEPMPAQRTGGNGKRRFKAPKTARYQQAVCDAAVAAGLPRVGLDVDEGAIVVAVLYMPRSNARERAKKREGRIVDVSGPDVDNVAKSLLDGMQLQGGPLADDCRVCGLLVLRRLVPVGGTVGAVVALARVQAID